ncbi:MAG: glycosyltransferase [Chloroflexales bacterium]|nr:glycosyltransferase [Chloroflexales bacterium]
MRILLLCPYPPYPPRSGGALRIYNLLAGLAPRHELWCLTFAPDDAAVAALKPLCEYCRVVTVRGLLPRSTTQRAWTTLTSSLPDMALRNTSPAYAAALRQLLCEQHFDIVQAASIEMAHYGLSLRDQQSANGRVRRPHLILDEFNAEYVLQYRAALTTLRSPRLNPRSLAASPYSLVQWRKLAAYERRLLRAYDYTLAVSAEDRRALLKLDPAARIGIVPNGVDCAYFDRRQLENRPSIKPQSLVFTGTLDFRPNVDAVTWFAREVLPLVRAQQPAARFVVVGRAPAPAVRALHDGVMVDVIGEVADVRPFIDGAAAYVVPMRMGGGVRLKLLEALAMQAPVVSTTMGAEGVEGLHDGAQLLLADTPAAFAAAVLRLLADPALGRQLGAAGRELVLRHYDWQAIVPLLEKIYAELPQP